MVWALIVEEEETLLQKAMQKQIPRRKTTGNITTMTMGQQTTLWLI